MISGRTFKKKFKHIKSNDLNEKVPVLATFCVNLRDFNQKKQRRHIAGSPRVSRKIIQKTLFCEFR